MVIDRSTLRHRRRLLTSRRTAVIALAGGAVIALAMPATGSAAAVRPQGANAGPAPAGTHATGGQATGDKAPFYDSRADASSRQVLRVRAAQQAAAARPGLKALRTALGVQGVIAIDPLTATPRTVSRLDGFLTGPSRSAPSAVVTGYIRGNPDVFGLNSADLATLRLRRDYVDVAGVHHLSWVQYAGNVPVFGNGLKAAVTKDGRLVNVQGSPLSGLHTASTATKLDAVAARTAAAGDVFGRPVAAKSSPATGAARSTRFGNGDRAGLVVFQSVAGPRVAWQTLTTPAGGQLVLHVVDATTGRVLYRHRLVADAAPEPAAKPAAGPATGSVWENYPGAPKGGTAKVVNLTASGWLPADSPRLAGNTAHVFSDVNDDNVAQAAEEVPPGPDSFRFPFVNVNSSVGGPFCSARYQCSWNPSVANSWTADRRQNAVQVFYYVSKFHDHLKAAPIGFTRVSGNFEAVDGDAVDTQPDDGADTAGGLPDSSHVDNANMSTPPDGTPPTMQMYLFHSPANSADPFLQANGGDDASIVYHEYTHGLSNRLVVDASGVSTLGNVQAGSMGEAWSDWYAMDFLTNSGFQTDTAAPGEVRVGDYVAHGADLLRTQPLDCPVGTTSARCPGSAAAGPGGYTYGDFGQVIGQPEVHADGEIWGETLWDLRAALGSKLAESLVTRAMELSVANPSFLDMRNAIVQADAAVNGGAARTKLWRVFAHRGMGFFAAAVDGDDTAPVEDFSLPPAPGTPRGSLTGTVVDDSSHAGISQAVVVFGGHASGLNAYTATTDAAGKYTIDDILPGTYPKVSAGGAGFDRQVQTVSIASRVNTLDWNLRRDWAALAGGASVTDTNGDEYAGAGCGADRMIDQSQGQGWSTDRILTGSTVTAKFLVVKLPVAVNIAQVAIDPSNTCGDGGSASTGPYTLETSTDGTTWTPAAGGTFTPADRGHFSLPSLAAGSTAGVQYLRYTMQDSQALQVGTCPGPFSGCSFVDSRELEVYGVAAP